MPPASSTTRWASDLGTIELVGRDQHRRPLLHRPADEAVELVAGLVVQSAWGSSSSQSSGRRASRQASEVRRRCPADRRPTDTPVAGRRGQPGPWRRRCRRIRPAGATPEPHVVGDRQVVEQIGGVAQQADVAADRSRIPPQVVTEHDRLAAHDGNEAGAGAGSTVVFPAPFGPRSRTISPRATSRSIPASAGKRPSSAAARRWTTGSMTTAQASDLPSRPPR